METTIYQVADYFLYQQTMTHKKLQKLCYYAQAWHLANYDKPLFPSRFEAWLHGPVSPDLYVKYHEYGWCEIPQNAKQPDLPSSILCFLNLVWIQYGAYCDFELENFAKSEYPWKHARENAGLMDYCRTPILWSDMKTTYKQRLKQPEGDL